MREVDHNLTGQLLFEQKMHNVRLFIIVFCSWQFLGFLLGIVWLRMGITSGSMFWIILSILLISVTSIVITFLVYFLLYSKIQVYENGIVIPSGMKYNIPSYKKYGIRGVFYSFDDLSDFRAVGNNRLYFTYKGGIDYVYILTRNLRDILISEILKAQEHYLLMVGTDKTDEGLKNI